MSIWIGGLDACYAKNRQEHLESSRDTVLASPSTRLFPNGKLQIRAEIERAFSAAIMILLTPTLGDIERYLKRRLN